MDEPVNNAIPSDDEFHLLDYLIILAKHSRMIIFASATVTVLTYLILFILPNKYTATASLMPPQQNLTLSAQMLDSMRGGVAPGVGAQTPGGSIGGIAASLIGLKSPSDMYVAMMTGNTTLNHIIDRFHLMKLYKTKYLEDARKVLKNNILINPGKKDGIIVIEVTSTNPKLSAAMANAFIEELDLLLQRLAVQEAKSRLTFLEQELVQASQNLTKAEEALRLFSEKNNVLQIDIQTRGAIEYIARLRAEIDSREVSIQVLRQQATPFNYDTVRMETEIKGLKEKLQAAESQWENCISNVCLPASKGPSLGLEYLRLFRETKFRESLYQLFTKTVEIARVDLVRDVAVVQVLDPATPPERKSSKRLFPAILAGILTFFIMIVVAFGQEHIQNVKNREDGARRLTLLKGYLQPWKDILTRKRIKIFSRK